MSKSNTFENDWLKLVFNAVAIGNMADNAASSPLTALYVSLHTADPGEAGTQATSETTYAGYARVGVARTSSGWVVSNNSVSPVANVTFPTSTDAGQTITHFGVGVAASGASKLLYSGALTPTITTQIGVTPILSNTSTITED